MIVIELVFLGSALLLANNGVAQPYFNGHMIPAEELHLSGAEQVVRCAMLLATPIPPTDPSEVKTWPIELHESAGFVVHPGETIPTDAISGFDLWQTWRNGDLAIVPRYNVEKFMATGQGVNTHEAFEHLFEKTYGVPIGDNIAGSGEKRRAFTEDWYVNNKSGKRRGGEETLQYAKLMIPARGGRISEHTIWHPMNRALKTDIGHMYADRVYDRWQLKLMAQVLSEPEGAKLVGLIERLGRAILPLAGHAVKVGEYFATAVRGSPVGLLRGPLQHALSSAARTDGIYCSIQSDWWTIASGRAGPEYNHAITAPLLIARFIETQRTRLTAEAIVELESISDEFASLPVRHADPAAANRLKRIERPKSLDATKDIIP